MQRLVPANKYKFYSYNLIFAAKKLLLYTIVILLLPASIFAEGSKELNANGGSRAFLYSSTVSSPSFPFPTQGTLKVYVKAGETLYIGSSAQGIGTGTINLRAPDGSTYTSGTSTSVGSIANRAQEIAGPQPNGSGYTPYIHAVAANQAGIWEVDFIGTSNTANPENPTSIAAGDNWVQPIGQYIEAFDISVRDASNTSFLSGRVYTNIFCGLINSFSTGFNAIVHILTKDGYQYTMDNNGQAGNGFSFFVNNKGFRNTAGTASYQSINSTNNPNVQDPRAADTQTDITHKIFFNTPAADLPLTAATPGGSNTWLLNPPFVPSISSSGFIGAEGTTGKAGTTPLGGTISFSATNNGSYTIIIDANNNGDYTDPIDRTLTGIANTGVNQLVWDGLDGFGAKVPAGASYTANINLSLYSAEVHFPFFDVERNINGIKLTRTGGINSPDNTVYWDDSQLTLTGTPSNPIKNLTGVSSLGNGHKWGTATSDSGNENDFGNNRSIDTWAYVSSVPLTATVTFALREADLEVVSLTSNTTGGCVGQKISYTAVVRNNGPNDVTGAVFSFGFPNELTKVIATSSQTTATTNVTAESTIANLYKATLDITSGGIRTFVITGTVTAAPAGSINVTAGITRPVDVTDGNPINDSKTNSTNFVAAPNAGADVIIEVNTPATLTANTAGAWAQIGISPAIANINAPNNSTTNITGLTTIGTYSFIFTNLNGCADTVNIKAVSSNLTTPNIFTPNGDGKNDVYEIAGITLYPGSQFLVYNRWGNEVYRSENYANTWDGKGLAEGTYYYILNRKEKTGDITTFKGWIYLKR